MPAMVSCAFSGGAAMRGELNKLAMCLDAIVLGIALAQLLHDSVRGYAGIVVAVVGAVAMIFAIRDAICALLRHFGREGNPDKVLVHMSAAVMALLGLGAASDPRGSWVFVLVMPAMAYFLPFAIDRGAAALGQLMDRLLQLACKGRRRP